jgi:CHASE1-domain containing sensor protein
MLLGKALLVLGTGALLTAGAATLAVQDRPQTDLAPLPLLHAAELAQARVAAQLHAYSALVQSNAALFAASNSVTAAEFGVFVGRLGLTEDYPAIQSMGFSRRLTSQEAGRPLRVGTSYGGSDVRVWPDGLRAEYHAIVYLEPPESRNPTALGYDAYSEPVRRTAMERARDLGKPALTGRVLVLETNQPTQPGLILYAPVYAGGALPGTIAERQSRLLGYVFATFSPDVLFADIFLDSHPEVAFRVYDGTQPDASALLYASPTADSSRATGAGFNANVPLEVAGHTWTIEAVATRGL